MDFKNTWRYHQTDNRKSLQNASGRLGVVMSEIGKLRGIQKTLDIGFGDAQLLKLLSTKYDSYGIDFVPENIEITKRNTQLHNKVKNGNILNIPFEANTFDLVTATEILEHLTEDELSRGLKEIQRVLKPNGYLLFTVPYNESLQEKMTCCPNCNTIFHFWGHQQSFNEKNIKKNFGKLFNIIKLQKTFLVDENLNFFGLVEFYAKVLMKKYKGYMVILKSKKR